MYLSHFFKALLYFLLAIQILKSEKVKSLSRVRLFATPWTVASQSTGEDSLLHPWNFPGKSTEVNLTRLPIAAFFMTLRTSKLL